MFKQSNQNSFFGNFLTEQAVEKNNFLRQLSKVVDFTFINEICSPLYPRQFAGNRPYEPALLFKMLLLTFFYDISDREIEEQVNDRISFKWFLGLAINDKSPDHSTLTIFRERLGKQKFEEIFNYIVDQARTNGLVHDRLKIIDSTHIQANVDVSRLEVQMPNRVKDNDLNDDEDSHNNFGSPNINPDPDAKFGRKSATKGFYGYKGHIITDADSGIIEGIEVTPGNIKDEQVFEPLLDKTTFSNDQTDKTRVTADKGYDIDINHQAINNHDGESYIIHKKSRKREDFIRLQQTQKYQNLTKERRKIEQRFADGKGNHGLNRCRWLGIVKTTIQVLLTGIVLNCKKLVKLYTANYMKT
jgi:IS5 family transposase